MSNMSKMGPIRISVDEAKEKVDQGGVTTLDVVDPGTYEERPDKIAGAVRIDPRDIQAEYERLPQEETILTYCT